MVCAVGLFSINYFRKTKVARRRAPPEKCPPLGGPSLIKLALAKKGTGGVEGRDKKGEGGWRRGGESKNEKKGVSPQSSHCTQHVRYMPQCAAALRRCGAGPGAGRHGPWPCRVRGAGAAGRRPPWGGGGAGPAGGANPKGYNLGNLVTQ